MKWKDGLREDLNRKIIDHNLRMETEHDCTARMNLLLEVQNQNEVSD